MPLRMGALGPLPAHIPRMSSAHKFGTSFFPRQASIILNVPGVDTFRLGFEVRKEGQDACFHALNCASVSSEWGGGR